MTGPATLIEAVGQAKIGPHREAMQARIAELVGLDPTEVSIKATTTEQMGFTGRGEGIAVLASVILAA